MRVAVDAMGGDNAPEPIVRGAVEGAREHDVEVILVGDQSLIRPCFPPGTAGELADRVTIEHTEDYIRMDESGLQVLRRLDSSMSRTALLVKEGKADAALSMGNTGAAMAAGASFLQCIEGIKRPAIGLAVPTTNGSPFLLVDAGATADCTPGILLQFAHMGSTYAQDVFEVPTPRVGLLSNGEEAGKGSKLYKKTHKLLAASELNFVGNREPDAMLRGEVDVAVCDGFVGNVMLKALEGFADFTGEAIRAGFNRSPWTRMVGLLARPLLRRVFSSLKYDAYGGAALLGVQGILIVGHGRSNHVAVANAIGVARETHDKQVVEHIREAAASVVDETPENGDPG
jgi:glycerol-3-phosphate acyltransferase PlsX